MKNKFIGFFHFLFAAEDSSQRYGGPNIHTVNNEVTNKAKCFFWFSLSIVLSLIISKLH